MRKKVLKTIPDQVVVLWFFEMYVYPATGPLREDLLYGRRT